MHPANILLGLHDPAVREAIASCLTNQGMHVADVDGAQQDYVVDLWIVDRLTLPIYTAPILAWKSDTTSEYCPVLLVCTGEYSTDDLPAIIDEVLHVPASTLEIKLRIASLLRTRRMAQRLIDEQLDLSRFIGTLIHNVRSPLAAIVGFSSALLEDYSRQFDQQVRHDLHYIRESAGVIQSLTDALMQYKGLLERNVEHRQVSLRLVVLGSTHNAAARVRVNPSRVKVPQYLPPVMSDPALLQHALEALLANALLYVAPGQEPDVEVFVEAAANKRRIVVQDHGIGIATDQFERIFLPFVRLHRRDEYPGSGMGLAIVRRIGELLRTSVGVESIKGQGSRFWIEVDAAP